MNSERASPAAPWNLPPLFGGGLRSPGERVKNWLIVLLIVAALAVLALGLYVLLSFAEHLLRLRD